MQTLVTAKTPFLTENASDSWVSGDSWDASATVDWDSSEI